ncbi:unnamed protein product [Urochloa decumbens]|uniref:F-box domain-containing protein n=1 Tax=Urochloa decumbens TaxID=240449 RepID=A0ABC9FWN7_9POAL
METGSGRLGGGADRISSLPDDLLHGILLGLGCTKAAARTSVLSRRWRGVWARLPEFYLWGLRPVFPASCVTIVDRALAACASPTLRRLVIRVGDVNLPLKGVTAAHAAPWLRFASGCVAGELFLWLPMDILPTWRQEQDLDLPVCAATRSIQIRLRRNFRLRPPLSGGGAFAALTCLGIYDGVMDGVELGTLVSSSLCPCLEDLSLTVRLASNFDVCICSDSLKRLSFRVENTRSLVVAAPVLLEICVSKTREAHIAAPKLADVELIDDMDHCEIDEAGCHLQRLVVNLRFPLAGILQRFDTIKELIIDRLVIQSGTEGYNTFLKDLRRLDCESLVTQSMWTCHGFAPIMLRLLRICNGLRKFVVALSGREGSFGCASDCPCTWPESCRNDNFVLDSLEEIEINGFTGKDHQLECLNLLLGCNAPLLKKVVFRLSCIDFLECTDIIREKIRGKLPLDIELSACLKHRKPFGILDELDLYT